MFAVPDTNRRWVYAGATWKALSSLEYSAGYTHLFLDSPRLALTSVTGSSLSGSYDLGSDVFALAVTASSRRQRNTMLACCVAR